MIFINKKLCSIEWELEEILSEILRAVKTAVTTFEQNYVPEEEIPEFRKALIEALTELINDDKGATSSIRDLEMEVKE